MKFREMLKLYKDGTLDAPQRELVETEIEKHEAISDYLYESSNIPELEDVVISEGIQEDREAEKFTKAVRSAVRRAFVKMGVIVGAVTIAVVLAVIFVLPNLVSKFYYDPNEVVGGSEDNFETTRMSLDLAVCTEMFCPYDYRESVIAEEQGYGEYEIIIPQAWSKNGIFTDVAGKLERNKLTLYDPNVFKLVIGNAFVPAKEIEEDWAYLGSGAAGTKEDAFAALKDLDENETHIAHFSLENLMDYESFYQEFGNIGAWCAVYNKNNPYNHFGFAQNTGGAVMHWDEEEYPCLNLTGLHLEEDPDYPNNDEEVMETHFLSMLKYMRDNPEIAVMLGHSAYGVWEDSEAWDHDIDHIEENGIKIFGFVVTADKETILELSENENISYVYTTPAQ